MKKSHKGNGSVGGGDGEEDMDATCFHYTAHYFGRTHTNKFYMLKTKAKTKYRS